MPTKATTMPGGAPLKGAAKKPCKYGARINGKCPPKPKAAKKAKAKKPCKYGPRDADGLCPKKPPVGSIAKNAAGQVTIAQKKGKPKPVAQVLQKAVQVKVDREVGRTVTKVQQKIAKSDVAGNLKKAATLVVGAVARLNPFVLAGSAVVAGAVLGQRATMEGVNRMRADTEARMKRKLTPQEWAMLEPQYRQFVQNSFAAAAKKASGRG